MSSLEQQQAAQLAAQQKQLLQQKQALEQAQAHIAHLQQQAAIVPSSSSSSSSSSSLSSPISLSSSSFPFVHLLPNRPSSFSGSTGQDAEQWLIEMERYFLASNSPPDISSVLFASTYLRQSASMWFTAKYKGMSQLPATWKEFRDAFLIRFRPFAAARAARASLRSLVQDGSVTAYSDSFLRLVQLLPEMHVQDQLDAYLHGLRPRLAEAVDRTDPATLEAAIHTAQREELRSSESERHSNFRHGGQARGDSETPGGAEPQRRAFYRPTATLTPPSMDPTSVFSPSFSPAIPFPSVPDSAPSSDGSELGPDCTVSDSDSHMDLSHLSASSWPRPPSYVDHRRHPTRARRPSGTGPSSDWKQPPHRAAWGMGSGQTEFIHNPSRHNRLSDEDFNEIY